MNPPTPGVAQFPPPPPPPDLTATAAASAHSKGQSSHLALPVDSLQILNHNDGSNLHQHNFHRVPSLVLSTIHTIPSALSAPSASSQSLLTPPHSYPSAGHLHNSNSMISSRQFANDLAAINLSSDSNSATSAGMDSRPSSPSTMSSSSSLSTGHHSLLDSPSSSPTLGSKLPGALALSTLSPSSSMLSHYIEHNSLSRSTKPPLLLPLLRLASNSDSGMDSSTTSNSNLKSENNQNRQNDSLFSRELHISDSEELLVKLLRITSRCLQSLENEGLLYERDLLLAPLAATLKPLECSLSFSVSEYEIMELNKRTLHCEQITQFVLQHRHPNHPDMASPEAAHASSLPTDPSNPQINKDTHLSDDTHSYADHSYATSVNPINGEHNLLSNDASGSTSSHSLLRSRKRMCKVTGRSMYEEKELAFSYFLRPDLADKDIMQVYLQYKRELGGSEHAKCPISRAEFYRIAPEAKKRKLKEQGRSTCEHCHKDTGYSKAETSPSVQPSRSVSSRKKRNANNDKIEQDRRNISDRTGESDSTTSHKHSRPSHSHSRHQPVVAEELQSRLPQPLTNRAPTLFDNLRDINGGAISQPHRTSLTTSQPLNHFPSHGSADSNIIHSQPSLTHDHPHSHMQTDCQDVINTDHESQLSRSQENTSIAPRPVPNTFPMPPPPYYFPWAFTSTPTIRPSILLRPRPSLIGLNLVDSDEESEMGKNIAEDGRFTVQSNPVCIGEEG